MLYAILIGLAFAGEPPQGEWDAGAGFEAMSASVRADVEDYVGGINVFKRVFARRALVRATAPCARVGIHDTADGLAIRCDDRKVAVAEPNGQSQTFIGDDGRALELVHDIDADGTVVQSFTNSRGTRVNRYTALDDGGLRVQVRITAGVLADPLTYELRYQP